MPVRAARISPASWPPPLAWSSSPGSCRKVGLGEIWSGLAQVGWGFAPIIALAGLRFAMRAMAWSLCLEPPHTLPFRAAFAAVVAGDAVGNLTPLGLFASEPAKAAFVRDRVPLGPAVTALAIENIFYTLSAAAMIGAATIALLITFDLPDAVRQAAWIWLVAIAVGFVVTALLLWRRPAVVRRALSRVVPSTSRLQDRVDQLHGLEEQIYTFAVRRRSVLVPLVAAEVMFHVLGVLEVYLTWWLIQGTAPPLLTAFIFEGANRLVQVLFKFVPLQDRRRRADDRQLHAMLGLRRRARHHAGDRAEDPHDRVGARRARRCSSGERSAGVGDAARASPWSYLPLGGTGFAAAGASGNRSRPTSFQPAAWRRKYAWTGSFQRG